MRHGFAHRKLNRTSEHRKALFQNMLNSLIKYEQITTTLPKAKELRPQIEKIITLGKKNKLKSKKDLFGKLQDKKLAIKVTKILSERYKKRHGGYCRIIKAGFRYGDNAPLAIIELVDRDQKARTVDVVKKPDQKAKTENESKKHNIAKKTVSKK